MSLLLYQLVPTVPLWLDELSIGNAINYYNSNTNSNSNRSLHASGVSYLVFSIHDSRSTMVGGGSTIPSPGMSLEQPLLGIGQLDLHGRQACSTHFIRGTVKYVLWRGFFSCRHLPKQGKNWDISPAPIR